MAKVMTPAMTASHSETHPVLSHTCTSQTSQMMMWGSTSVSPFTMEDLKIMRSTWRSQVGLKNKTKRPYAVPKLFQGSVHPNDSPDL